MLCMSMSTVVFAHEQIHCQCNYESLGTTSLEDVVEVDTLNNDVVEAHATALNQMGTLLSNHIARGVN